MKSVILAAILLCAISSVNAQKFLKAVPKPTITQGVVTAEVTEKTEFRPVINLASYAIGDNSLLNGGGVSYQKLKFDIEANRWKSQWSVNALAWYKSSFTGDGKAFAAGLTVGFFNDLIMIGGGKAFAKTEGSGFFGTMGIGINLNN